MHSKEVLKLKHAIRYYFIKWLILNEKFWQLLHVCCILRVLTSTENCFGGFYIVKYVLPSLQAKFQFFWPSILALFWVPMYHFVSNHSNVRIVLNFIIFKLCIFAALPMFTAFSQNVLLKFTYLLWEVNAKCSQMFDW